MGKYNTMYLQEPLTLLSHLIADPFSDPLFKLKS